LRTGKTLSNKILTLPEIEKQVVRWKTFSKTIAFTNGCFDILHPGHISSLSEAAQHGDFLIVGLNADSSIKDLKGKNRPINNEQSRATVLAALSMVDAVVIFSEPTPLELIKAIKPDVLVKGGDYTIEQIAGAKEVIGWGGKVVINPILEGFSTSSVINKIQNS
jgi:D-glycero-beta-D-manno-heptose 1-phosphate adenylyltransferase